MYPISVSSRHSGASLLNKEQLLDMGRVVMTTSMSDVIRVQLKHSVRAVTHLSNNRVLTSDSGNTLEIVISTSKGGRVSVGIVVDCVDDATLRAAVVLLDNLAREQIGAPHDLLYVPDGPQEYMPVSLWHDTTVQAITTAGDTTVPQLITALRTARMQGGGFLGVLARSTLVMQNDGLVAFNQETDTECSISARTSDGRASGWYGQAARDWAAIRPDVIAQKAIEIAKRSVNASAVEPGRRIAVLSPFAVAQVLRHVSSHFDAYDTNEGKATAFALPGDLDRVNKIGMRVFDPRIRITSDPADPLGGYVPFGDVASDGIAKPLRPMVWVQDGVLQDLAFNVYYGLQHGKLFSQNPWSMRVETKPGTPLQTIEEMIASCEEGIYVHRLSDVTQLDPLTGMQTGVTRDGCFLIKHGRIDRPVKNFRFADSPFYFLNRIMAIGKPERVAMGYTPPAGEPAYAAEWPRRPMIIPPLMIADFNFSALSDAV